MDGTRKKSPVIINLVVIASVVGVLASIAVPSYISMQRHARVEQLMKAAGACRDRHDSTAPPSLKACQENSAGSRVAKPR